ncbi:MAG: 5-formyltetrahydrofolate cyclo-ligase [bacterium]
MTPTELRQHIRKRRASLDELELKQASNAASKLLLQQPWFKNARNVAAYIPVGGEIDPLAMFAQHSQPLPQILLPVLRPFGPSRLWFAKWQPGDPLLINRYGIPEPYVDKNMINAWAIDVVLMPLVAVDRSGNRLGMGGGYYDRSFAFKLKRNHFNKPMLVGYAHAFQLVDKLESNSWDVPLDALITDKQTYDFKCV